MLSDRLSILTGGSFRLLLSVQQLIECFQPELACSGNSPEDALIWLDENRYKIQLDSDIPYKQFTNTKVQGVCPGVERGITIKKGSVRTLVEWIDEEMPDIDIMEKNIENMKLELINKGPFFAAITVYSDFYNYDGLDVYSHNTNSEEIGGHAIEVIGFCDPYVDNRFENSMDGYWICRNSWGSNWPTKSKKKGFFMIKMGQNECGIESRAAVADITHSGVTSSYTQRTATRFTDFKNFTDNLSQENKNEFIGV